MSLAGLAVSFSFARYANASPRRVWAAYVALTAVHLYANYAAMRILAFRSLNRRRLAVVLHAFCHSNDGVPTPAQAARQEVIVPVPLPLLPLLPGARLSRSFLGKKRLRLGARVKDLLGAGSAAELARLQRLFHGEAYLLKATPQGEVVVALREDATNLTLLKACLHVRIYARIITHHSFSHYVWPIWHGTARHAAAPIDRQTDPHTAHSLTHSPPTARKGKEGLRP